MLIPKLLLEAGQPRVAGLGSDVGLKWAPVMQHWEVYQS